MATEAERLKQTEEAWTKVEAELSEAANRDEYKPFRLLLDRLRNMANAKYPKPEDPDTVRGLFDVVNQMMAKAEAGADPQELAEQAASGVIQPNMNVQGNLDQAGRDFFKQVNFQFFSASMDELKQDDPNIAIPIVLLVMTDLEAQELESGKAFHEYHDEVYVEQFRELQTFLETKGMAQWRQRYQPTREEWQPFIESEQSIADLVTMALDRVEGYSKRLVPKFVDLQKLDNDISGATLSKDQQNLLALRREVKKLREESCVVIEDIISMRHPAIQRAYRRSLLDAFRNTVIVRVAPTSDAFRLIQQMIAFSEQYIDLEFFKRLSIDYDRGCEEVVGDMALGRWLSDQGSKLLPADEKSNAGVRQHQFK